MSLPKEVSVLNLKVDISDIVSPWPWGDRAHGQAELSKYQANFAGLEDIRMVSIPSICSLATF